MIDHGHPFHVASHYPIGRLVDEEIRIVRRLNNQEATRAMLLQMAISSVLSEKGGKVFNQTIKDMSEE